MVNKQKSRKDTSDVQKISGRDLKDIEELVLPSSKLKFCSEQLQNLNYIFTKRLSLKPDPEYAKAVLLAKSVTERLIQRLFCGVGLLDQRFSSKFLIALHDTQSNAVSRSLEYIIRLDSLSKPQLYSKDPALKYSIIEGDFENCPPGYARIRLNASCGRMWSDFINSNGFLRRDKVQAKIVELLAAAASGDTPNSPLAVDESIFCASPGKVVDAFTLYHVLHTPTEQHVFYGPGGNAPRFPDPRDFKLAIVDEPTGIRLRVGFLSPALASISIEVRLLVAVGLDVWPSTTDFPFRIPLAHSDCVLYHRAAQTGLYLTGYGVQSSAWQIRLPAAEFVLANHYSQSCAIVGILKTLHLIVQDVNEANKRHQVSYKILNNYSLWSTLFYHLEMDLAGPSAIVLNWSPKYLSAQVLKILDRLVRSLRNQHLSNYFFPTANLLVNPGHLCEDDFALEANRLKGYMLRLFDESLVSLRMHKEFNRFVGCQRTELILLNKWKELVDGLMPPPSTRGRRICFAGSKYKKEVVYTQYTTRQLEYIGIVLKNMLFVKQNVLQAPEDFPWATDLRYADDFQEDPIEDVIYILVTLLEQARDKYLEALPCGANVDVIKAKLKRQFEAASSRLVESVRKENETTNSECLDDMTMVKIILKWLYKGMDQNKKSLAPVLRPYLRTLFVASHGASWHLEAIKNRNFEDEARALGTFARLVNCGSITPAQGLIDAVGKNWTWAKDMLKTMEEDDLRLVFVPSRGKVNRHILFLPKKSSKDLGKSLDNLKVRYAQPEWSTLPPKHYFSTILYKTTSSCGSNDSNVENFRPLYTILMNSSPMTTTISLLHRKGEHRCCGDILETLLAMQKVNVLQEISTLLPSDERADIQDALRKLTNERGTRTTASKKKSNSFVQLSNSKRKIYSEDQQKYTPKEESAGIRETVGGRIIRKRVNGKDAFRSNRWETEESSNYDKKHKGATLIGSCRAARIRDDTNVVHFQDNFKIQSSTVKHYSFKY